MIAFHGDAEAAACRLELRGGRVLLCRADRQAAVRLVLARPLTGEEISLLDESGRELLMLPSLDALEPRSRAIAEAALAERYLVPRVLRVVAARAQLGVRYWHVLTDRGERSFAMKDPARGILRIGDDQLVLRDAQGNRYRIASLAALDQRSRELVERIC